MKNLALLLLASVGLTFTACECQKCSHAYLPDSEICRDDFDSMDEFNDAVEAAENVGYDCNY